MKPCLDCKRLTSGSRCADCARAKDKSRGTRQQRGYGAEHDRLRADYQARMDAGEKFACWRCSRPVNPTAWDLGHDDSDRTKYRGPECRTCNRGTATRR